MNKIFGEQARFAAAALQKLTRPVDAGGDEPHRKSALTKLVMQVVVSLVILGYGAFSLRQGISPEQQKAVWASIGVVVGYWLR